MARMTVEECHQTGGRLEYIGERPVCIMPTGDGEEIAIDLETRRPVGDPVPSLGGRARSAGAGLVLYAAAAVALLVAVLRRRGR